MVTYEQLLLLPRQQENDQMSFPNDLSVLTLCAFQQRCILIGCLSQGSFLIGCLGQGCSLIGCLSHLAFHGLLDAFILYVHNVYVRNDEQFCIICHSFYSLALCIYYL